jgi:hypothetical protein
LPRKTPIPAVVVDFTLNICVSSNIVPVIATEAVR